MNWHEGILDRVTTGRGNNAGSDCEFLTRIVTVLAAIGLNKNTAEMAVFQVQMVGLGRLELPTSTLSE